ncbi:homocysteine S-methyltransferase-like [Odontomachus brunneus]|uniref:homocysteine S-methyltransferase-like n=1 Tax=Odontomachus brunneus TaxID=486640 RepID=UPI0013F21FD4|nr:homocysteine S-methyltransferase-like [Odontomachus brunneus]
MSQSPIVLDGDFNSQAAISMGKTSIDNLPTMLWTLNNQVSIFNTHLEFLRAGANMIRTNTYHASIYNLNHFVGIDVKDSSSIITNVASIARKAVFSYLHETSKNATNQEVHRRVRPCIVGFCGPYGASLGNGSEYTGAYGNALSQSDLVEWHKTRAKALLDAKVDILALGSVPCAKEAAAFVEMLQNFPHIRAWITFYCYNERILADGSDFRKIIKHCCRTMGNQMMAIGVSCIESRLVSPLFNVIHRETFPYNVPLIACPDKTSYRFKEDFTIEIIDRKSPLNLPISEWLNMGATIIGGCCGTIAHDIKYIRSEIEKYNVVQQKKSTINDNNSNVVKTKL